MKMELDTVNKITCLLYRLRDAEEINEGWCFYWAWTVYCLYGGTLCSAGEGHAFIKINNKYYDSECLQGADDWQELRFFRNRAGVRYDYLEEEEERHYFARWSFDPNERLVTRALENARHLIRYSANNTTAST